LHYSLPATPLEEGHREYWRNGWRQKLLDLDGIVDRGIDGPAARAGGKLRDFAVANARGKKNNYSVNHLPELCIYFQDKEPGIFSGGPVFRQKE
jgi:hypothetical protein